MKIQNVHNCFYRLQVVDTALYNIPYIHINCQSGARYFTICRIGFEKRFIYTQKTYLNSFGENEKFSCYLCTGLFLVKKDAKPIQMLCTLKLLHIIIQKIGTFLVQNWTCVCRMTRCKKGGRKEERVFHKCIVEQQTNKKLKKQCIF